ncbi:MAG: hypothetical protein AUK55_01495 [Syntrophobacteraceae bacterium CG2_30_61_12]|nr:MAG: hypothetical protein AUK55_01495 [Syntrophobacteraceae bacterium CG2_30_61_12]
MSAIARFRGRHRERKPAARARTGQPGRRSAAAPARRVRIAPRKKSGTGSGSSSRLPLAAVWLLAVISLASLIYWGGGFHKPAKRAEPAARTEAPIAASVPAGAAAKPDAAAKPANRHEIQAHPAAPPTRAQDAGVQPAREPAPAPPPIRTAAVVPAPVEPPPPPPPVTQPALGRVAIVIDDFGRDLEMAREFIRLPFPVTLSILPRQPHSREIAELAHRHQRQVMLHLPMEPRGYPKTNPGSGALLLAMSEAEIVRTMNLDLDNSPYAVGVNNHMGSGFTEHADKMRIVIRELQRRRLFFLDSFTSARSIGLSLAEQAGLPARRRDIFLDHEQSPQFLNRQLKQLLRQAKIQGSAVAIGHPHALTLNVLREHAELFAAERIEVVALSELMP